MSAQDTKPKLHKVTAENAMQALGEWPIQKFHVSHLATSEFKGEGLRPRLALPMRPLLIQKWRTFI
jgi:hypothetical protein